jgi:putative aldouronate transport system substrate-binding protein
MKKLAVLLAALMLLCCIPASALTLSEPGTLPITDETVTLTVWAQETVGRDYETCPQTVNLEKMTGVHVEWKMLSSTEDQNTAFNLSIASNDLPDVYFSRWFRTTDITNCIEGNVLLPLDDLIESDGVYYRQALEEQPQYRDMLTATDGHIYTFMYTDTGVHKDCEYKMWVKASWLDTLGIEMPTTPEEFKNLLIAIRDNDVNGNGDATDEIPLVGYYNGRQTDPVRFLMNPFELYRENYYVITDDGEMRFLANTDGWRDGLRYLADLYAEGLIAEETYVQDSTQFNNLLNKPAEEAIVGTFPCWYQGAQIDTNVLDWTDYIAVPPLEGPTGLRQAAARKGGNFNMVGAITTSCENPVVAFRWMDWMISEDGSYFGMYGVEGENFEWVDEPSYYGDEKSIARITSDVDTLWNSGTFPRYDRAYIRYATTQNPEAYTTDNTYVLLSAAQAYEPYYVWHNIPDVVWCADEDIIQERADYQTLFNDYILTTNTQFVMGELDINDDDVWAEYVAELDAMGLEDYMAVLAEYYDVAG